MCGIAGIFGKNWRVEQLKAMHAAQRHRGFDAEGFYFDAENLGGLAHNRLSIIDLSAAGRQPLQSADGTLQIALNGEIYNYLELRHELESGYRFQTQTDTEVLLAAFQKWGAQALDRLVGMFAFIIWDERAKTAFAARDRFGVKPLYFHENTDGTLFLASEIKAIHAAGIGRAPNEKIWADFLAHGLIEHSTETFWKGIYKLPAGHFLMWENGRATIKKWYDLREKTGDEFDDRSDAAVAEEYLALLKDSVRLRFRADVPVGINLSGGVDSSTLLGLVHALEKDENAVAAYTFTTGDERYDELTWVRQMLEKTRHPLIVSELAAAEIPDLAAEIQNFQDEPFGGVPTLAYAKLFKTARENGTIVLLDGNGLDEQWAGYDYYAENASQTNLVQGAKEKPVRTECLTPEFRALARSFALPKVFGDRLRNLQNRDTFFSKLPRALRYNDRVSMRVATELREPFLDQRLFELAFRQPAHRKIYGGVHKKMLREIVRKILPERIAAAPKRPLQTPQREWLRGDLRAWADAAINDALKNFGGAWLDTRAVRREWENFCAGASDNSFYVWQWISLSLIAPNFSGKNFENYEFASRNGYQSKRSRQEISAR
jgi:asparagine synthase (glutamine-hydrolysing)